MRFGFVKIIFVITSIGCSGLLEAAGFNNIFFGNAISEVDPKADYLAAPTLLTSVQGQLKSGVLGSLIKNIPNTSLLLGDGYLGFHFVPILSFHVKRRYILLSDLGKENSRYIKCLSEAWFVMIGNPVTTRGHLLLGRIPIPFGMAFQESPDVLDLLVKQHRFDEKYGLGMQASYLDLVGAQIDVGIFAKEYDNYLDTADPIKREPTYSLRLIKDIPALNGVRLVFSVLREISGESRISTAVYNRSTTGSTTELEWARRDRSMYDLLQNSDQVVRIFYGHGLTHKSEITFQYEDDFLAYWITSFGYRYGEEGGSKFGFDSTISYYRSREISQSSGWLGTLGGRVRI